MMNTKMSVKLFKKLTVAGDITKFNYLPALAEILTITAGVLMITTSIIGAGMLIEKISTPSLAQIDHQPLQTDRDSKFN